MLSHFSAHIPSTNINPYLHPVHMLAAVLEHSWQFLSLQGLHTPSTTVYPEEHETQFEAVEQYEQFGSSHIGVHPIPETWYPSAHSIHHLDVIHETQFASLHDSLHVLSLWRLYSDRQLAQILWVSQWSQFSTLHGTIHAPFFNSYPLLQEAQ